MESSRASRSAQQYPAAAQPVEEAGSRFTYNSTHLHLRKRMKTKAAAIVLVVLVVTTALGYWAYGEYQKRQQYLAAVALVKDTSLRLRDALNLEADPASASKPEIVRKLSTDAADVDQRFQALHRGNTTPDQDWASAVEDYVLTIRQILQYQTSSHQHHLHVIGDIEVLRQHMLKGDRGSASWIPEAIRAKDRLETDFRDYRRAVEAFDSLLGSYADALEKLGRHIDSTALVNQTLVTAARTQALEALKQTANEIGNTRQLDSYR